MARLEITPESLIVHITGIERLLRLSGELRVPLAHVTEAGLAGESARAFAARPPGRFAMKSVAGHEGFLPPGGSRKAWAFNGNTVYFPGWLVYGAFWWQGDWTFWDVRAVEKAVEITLHDDRYAKLVVSVDDPEAGVAAIGRALPAAQIGTIA